jgi:hypothetical protein
MLPARAEIKSRVSRHDVGEALGIRARDSLLAQRGHRVFLPFRRRQEGALTIVHRHVVFADGLPRHDPVERPDLGEDELRERKVESDRRGARQPVVADVHQVVVTATESDAAVAHRLAVTEAGIEQQYMDLRLEAKG